MRPILFPRMSVFSSVRRLWTTALGLSHVRRQVAVLAVAALIAWTQLFLGVHELSHLGQRDASACRFALVVSTVGGGDMPAQLVLAIPVASHTLLPLPILVRELPGEVSTQQARAPPPLA